MKSKEKNFDTYDYQRTMEQFLLVLKMGLNKFHSKEAFKEALDTEIKLVRNSLVWKYNYRYFNVSFKTVDRYLRSVYAFDFLQEFCPVETIKDFDLKNKCFFCDLWDPVKFFNINKKVKFDSQLFWFKNLQIGRIQGEGNHKLLKAIVDDAEVSNYVQDDKNKVDILCFDDTIFLKEWTTDGKYFYNGMLKQKTIDSRNAVLFSLTKLKLGFVGFEELYEQITNHKLF